jgi:hypothetical protein
MDKSTINDLRRRAEQQHSADIAAADRKFQETLRAIELVSGLVGGLPAGAIGVEVSPTNYEVELGPYIPELQRHAKHRWPGFRQAVWDAIEESPDEFSARLIMEYMGRHFPSRKMKHARISSELWRLRQLGRITMTERGTGRSPSLYAVGKPNTGEILGREDDK